MELVSRDEPVKKPTTTVVGQGLHALAFSPDSTSLAVTCEESQLRVFSVRALQRSSSCHLAIVVLGLRGGVGLLGERNVRLRADGWWRWEL